jgi:uncharacterized NAD(P)/FAD-binding protein YdhS
LKTPELIVVGGGFSGLCTAVTAARENPNWSILLFERGEHVGQGLAYCTTHADHRLNAPVVFHSVFPFEPAHIIDWCQKNSVSTADPQAQTLYGSFIRRSDYARYLSDTLNDYRAEDNGPGITVCHQEVTRVKPMGDACEVTTAQGASHVSPRVVLAPGNPDTRLPAAMHAVAGHANLVINPWDAARMSAILPDAQVLLVGASLTAADQICTLLAQGHRGPIDVISRHGLRPTHWPVPPEDRPALPDIAAVFEASTPDWIESVMRTDKSVRSLTRALRVRIKELKTAGETWESGFDELRNVVCRIWPQLPTTEKRRFLDRLRPWYDVYRFRIPPQTHQLIQQAERSGQVTFHRAALVNATGHNGQLVAQLDTRPRMGSRDTRRRWSLDADVMINCTGFDLGGPPAAGSLMAQLESDDLLVQDPSGVGYRTDPLARCINSNDVAQPNLHLVGPQTAGAWGDPLGTIFIAMQIRRMLDGIR